MIDFVDEVEPFELPIPTIRSTAIPEDVSHIHRVLQDMNQLENRLSDALRANSILKAKSNPAKSDFTFSIQVDELKSNIDKLLINDLKYAELKAIPKLTLLEQVQLQVFEEHQSLIVRLNQLTKHTELMDQLKNENSHLKRQLQLSENEVSRLKTTLINCESEVGKLSDKTVSLENQLAISRSTADAATNLIKERDHLKYLLEEAAKQEFQHRFAKDALQTELTQKTQSLNASVRVIELLKLDKIYLEKEIGSLKNREQELQSKLHTAASDMERLKQSTLQNVQDALKASNQRDQLQDEKFVTEQMHKLYSMDQVKTQLKEVYEREIGELKARLDTVEVNNAILSQQSVKLQQEINHKTSDYAKELSKAECKVQALSSAVKIKTFEAERIHVLYQETLETLKREQQQKELVQKKLYLVTSEYQELQHRVK